MKRRGRPRNADNPVLQAQDDAIARSVSLLMMQGYPKLEVYEALAKAAKRILGRTDHANLALSGIRIEKIYMTWCRNQGKPALRWRYKTAWLRKIRREQYKTLQQLACEMLERGGKQPDLNRGAVVTDLYGQHSVLISDYMLDGDPELTPKGEAEEAGLPRVKNSIQK